MNRTFELHWCLVDYCSNHNFYTAETEPEIYAALAQYCRDNWEDADPYGYTWDKATEKAQAAEERMPATDKEIIDLYFELTPSDNYWIGCDLIAVDIPVPEAVIEELAKWSLKRDLDWNSGDYTKQITGSRTGSIINSLIKSLGLTAKEMGAVAERARCEGSLKTTEEREVLEAKFERRLKSNDKQ